MLQNNPEDEDESSDNDDSWNETYTDELNDAFGGGTDDDDDGYYIGIH